jgi:putative aldouronate transport system permease protein
MSWVVVSYLAFAFLSTESGLINKSILGPLGMPNIAWYQEKQYWPFILIFVNAWKSIGYNMIIYLAAIVKISQDYYEAAALDGANKWQQIRKITLPMLTPTMLVLLALSLRQIFRSDFGLFYQIPKNSGSLSISFGTGSIYNAFTLILQNPNQRYKVFDFIFVKDRSRFIHEGDTGVQRNSLYNFYQLMFGHRPGSSLWAQCLLPVL